MFENAVEQASCWVEKTKIARQLHDDRKGLQQSP